MVLRDWKREHDREDGHRPIAAQLLAGKRDGDRPWPTHEPRVRLDIQTAVQIASLSDQPLGLVELLVETAAVPLEPHDWPTQPVVVEKAITMGDAASKAVVATSRQYRDKLMHRIRAVRQTLIVDAPAHERRMANRREMAREARLERWITILMWTCVVGAAVFGAMTVFGVWTSP